MNKMPGIFFTSRRNEPRLKVPLEPPYHICPIKCENCDDKTNYEECPRFQTAEEQKEKYRIGE